MPGLMPDARGSHRVLAFTKRGVAGSLGFNATRPISRF